ncbi:YlbE-like family protein [Oceanobacillus indicireducens]|uniref:YlbE-like protein n=1 Tax=Oceanobacillus indicireducens TaxID=1004261 RepID=A0A917XS15_9BACI|nr:YlbE-like family protein [Oceanobacillus indicireducens]GGN49131.1 hypothetical protein GCM10007971_01490 [Oceanobacillus indicireducens]
MEQAVYLYLREQPKLLEFIRRQPIWYRYLLREGAKVLPELEKEAKVFYGQTFSGRLNRVSDQVQMASMLINVANILKD